jgi:hypothetical protein
LPVSAHAFNRFGAGWFRGGRDQRQSASCAIAYVLCGVSTLFSHCIISIVASSLRRHACPVNQLATDKLSPVLADQRPRRTCPPPRRGSEEQKERHYKAWLRATLQKFADDVREIAARNKEEIPHDNDAASTVHPDGMAKFRLTRS